MYLRTSRIVELRIINHTYILRITQQIESEKDSQHQPRRNLGPAHIDFCSHTKSFAQIEHFLALQIHIYLSKKEKKKERKNFDSKEKFSKIPKDL